MTVAAYAFFIAYRLVNGLSEGDAHILNRMVCVDVQIAFGLDFKVNHAMTGNLIHHVFKEWHAGFKASRAIAIKIEADSDLCFQGVACYFGNAICHIHCF